MSAMALATYAVVAVFAVAYFIFFLVITVGGFYDLKQLLNAIRTEAVDPQDDGCHPGIGREKHDSES